MGGGITILDSRTTDDAGNTAVAFTNGHIAFRQSLLVRAEDAARLASHDVLTGAARVGVLASTTGEARLLQLTGLADADGVLAAGALVETGAGEVVADGSADYRITASEVSPVLEGRRHLRPPDDAMPQVVYLGDEGWAKRSCWQPCGTAKLTPWPGAKSATRTRRRSRTAPLR